MPGKPYLLISISIIFKIGLEFSDAACPESSSLDAFKRVDYFCGSKAQSIIDDSSPELWVNLVDYKNLPVPLFANSSKRLRKLVLSAVLIPIIQSIEPDRKFYASALDGLEDLTELQLRGFESIGDVEPFALKALRSLRCLYVDGFSSKYEYEAPHFEMLHLVLQCFANTPVREISLRHLRSKENPNRHLNLSYVFTIPNVTITSLEVEDTYISDMNGRLSVILADLESLAISLSDFSSSTVNSFMDIVFMVPKLRNFRISGYPAMIDVKHENFHKNFQVDGDIVEAIRSHIGLKNSKCFASMEIPLRFTTLSINRINHKRGPWSGNLNSPLCFSDSRLEYFDLSDCSVPTNLPPLSGLEALKLLNLRNISISVFSPQQLALLPKLEELFLAQNNLGTFIDFGAEDIFKDCPLLRTLDLSECHLSRIPRLLFSPLLSLTHLNLSGNNIAQVDWLFNNSASLSVLNLSNNAIERLSESFINMQINPSRGPGAPQLQIDLSHNPLSCLCNATEFVSWIQIQTVVRLVGLNDYNCLYPDGTWPNIVSVNAETLTEQCDDVMKTIINNSDCPCDTKTQLHYRRMRFALSDYYCKDAEGNVVSIKHFDSNVTKCVNFVNTPLFIGGVVGGGSFIILIAIVVIFAVVYRRKRPAEFQQIVECLGLNWMAGHLMAILYHSKEATDEEQRPFLHNSLVVFHPNDVRRVEAEFLDRLTEFGIDFIREDDFEVGGNQLQTLQSSIDQCHNIILILTSDFVSDNWLREVAICCTQRIRAVVPLVFGELPLQESDVCFRNILKTCRPIYWPALEGDQSRVTNEVKTRLTECIVRQMAESAF